MELRARITSKGQLTIPKEVRRALGIRKGDSLLFEVDDTEIRVRVVREPVSFAEHEGAWREEEGMSVQKVNDHVRELRGRGDRPGKPSIPTSSLRSSPGTRGGGFPGETRA